MRRLILLIALIATLALPAQVIAGGVSPNASGATQYQPVVPAVQEQQAQPPAPPIQPQAALPFTGEDVLLVVLAGLLLLGGGLTLYRQARQR